MTRASRQQLATLLKEGGRSAAEGKRLAELVQRFADLPLPPDPHGLFPLFQTYQTHLLETLSRPNGDDIEDAFLTLYCHVHGHEAPYTTDERRRMDETGGYWCHAGGISPVLKAEPFIGPETVSLDFGAGNGLQGLLLQKLYPHRLTIQVEISSKMVEAGRALQSWLGIAPDRVRWVVGDVIEHAETPADFIYLYRPVRPEGEGLRFYERLSRRLNRDEAPVVIFSIADCLAPFLSPQFETFYGDGHLTCFKRGGRGAGPGG